MSSACSASRSHRSIDFVRRFVLRPASAADSAVAGRRRDLPLRRPFRLRRRRPPVRRPRAADVAAARRTRPDLRRRDRAAPGPGRHAPGGAERVQQRLPRGGEAAARRRRPGASIGVNGAVVSISTIEFCAKLYESLAVGLSVRRRRRSRARLHVFEWGAAYELFDWGAFMVHMSSPRRGDVSAPRRRRRSRSASAHRASGAR